MENDEGAKDVHVEEEAAAVVKGAVLMLLASSEMEGGVGFCWGEDGGIKEKEAGGAEDRVDLRTGWQGDEIKIASTEDSTLKGAAKEQS